MQTSVFRGFWIFLLAVALQCALLISPNGSKAHISTSNTTAQENAGYTVSAGKSNHISKFYLHTISSGIFVSTEIQKAPFYQDFILANSVIELSKSLLQHQLAKINLYYADFFQLILFPFHVFW
ncbi:MAG TPA: hypothetical protein VEV16_02375 [Daejeonella sp.]|nr:hypothetical protein [Daejeonella sp.]